MGLAGFYQHRIREATMLLTSLTNSYRVLVDAADQFNRISMAHRDDVKEAVKRAEEMGDIVDEVLKELKYRLREYFRLDPEMVKVFYGENKDDDHDH